MKYRVMNKKVQLGYTYSKNGLYFGVAIVDGKEQLVAAMHLNRGSATMAIKNHHKQHEANKAVAAQVAESAATAKAIEAARAEGKRMGLKPSQIEAFVLRMTR